MPKTLRHSVAARQYRLATCMVVVGALSLGILLLRRFTELYFESIYYYYGLAGSQVPDMQGVGSLSLAVGQISVAVLALGGSVAFITNERRRVDRLHRHGFAHVRAERAADVTKLSRAQRLTTIIRRTALFAGVLFVSWFGQTAYASYESGLGWVPLDYYYSWTAMLPLVTVTATCLILGLFVACISMFGLRAIVALRTALAYVRSHARAVRPLPRRAAELLLPTQREIHGYALLSRPPPRAVYAA